MRLSYSQLATFERCPRQYEYAFIKRLKRPVSGAESFGASIHNTLKKWGETELDFKKQTAGDCQHSLFADPSRLIDNDIFSFDYLVKLWQKAFSVEGYKTKSEADEAREKGKILLGHFYEWWSEEKRNLIAVEESFSVSTGEIRLSGRFDRIEKSSAGLRVIDFKTSKEKTQPETDADLQLSVYALAASEKYKLPCRELMFLHLRPEGYTVKKTQRGNADLIKTEKVINKIKIKIESGDFRPSPGPACKNCPFNRICAAALL